MASRSLNKVVYRDATGLLAFLENGDGSCHAVTISVTGDGPQFAKFIRLVQTGAARLPSLQTVYWYELAPFIPRPLPYHFYIGPIVDTVRCVSLETVRKVNLSICTPDYLSGDGCNKVWLHLVWDLSQPDTTRVACPSL